MDEKLFKLLKKSDRIGDFISLGKKNKAEKYIKEISYRISGKDCRFKTIKGCLKYMVDKQIPFFTALQIILIYIYPNMKFTKSLSEDKKNTIYCYLFINNKLISEKLLLSYSYGEQKTRHITPGKNKK